MHDEPHMDEPNTETNEAAGSQNATINAHLTKRIYCDHAAATPLDPEVLAEMAPYWSEVYGNASAIHEEGRRAGEAVEMARARSARAIDAHADEIIFTSGGTESNNLAVFGSVDAYLAQTGKALSDIHLITMVVEHSSLLDCFKELERRGAAVTYLPVDHDGLLDPNVLAKALRPETVLVSIMLVNSEIGTIYPLAECARVIKQFRKEQESERYPLLHSDASQGPVYIDCSVTAHGVDLMSMDAQKMYGPKGIGSLYVRRDVPLAPILHGGGQERGLRPGTSNTPLVVGMARAFERANEGREAEVARMLPLRDHFIAQVEANIPSASLNGSRETRIANNASFAFPEMTAELLLLRLDAAGIACSTKSPCKGVAGGSHVIEALGKGAEAALTTLRFSFGRSTTKEDIDVVVARLKEAVAV